MFTFRGNAPSVPPKQLTPEQERRVIRDLALVVTQFEKNFRALLDGAEQVAMAADKLGLNHGLDSIVAKLREPVADAPEELPKAGPEPVNLGPTRDLTKAVSYQDQHGVTRWLKPGEFLKHDLGDMPPPRTTPTAQETRLILQEAGARYKDGWQELVRLGRGHEIEFAELPSSQRFRRRFHAAYLRYCPDGSPDDALATLGYRGSYGPLDEVDDEPLPNPYQSETPYQTAAAAENSGHAA